MKQFIRPAHNVSFETRQFFFAISLTLASILVLVGLICFLETLPGADLRAEWQRETPSSTETACAIYPDQLIFWGDGIYSGEGGVLAGGTYRIAAPGQLRIQDRGGYRVVAYSFSEEGKLVLETKKDGRVCRAAYAQANSSNERGW